MGIFSSKKKMTVEASTEIFKNGFIDIIYPDINSHTYQNLYGVFTLIFLHGSMDIEIAARRFMLQMSLLNLEIICHVWQCKFGSNYDQLVRHESHTKSMLESRGLGEMWDEMLPYNQAVAAANQAYSDPNSRLAKMGTELLIQNRLHEFSRLRSQGCPSDIAMRICNRIPDKAPWTRRSQALQILQTITLMENFCFPTTDSAPFALQPMITGLYLGTVELLNDVKII